MVAPGGRVVFVRASMDEFRLSAFQMVLGELALLRVAGLHARRHTRGHRSLPGWNDPRRPLDHVDASPRRSERCARRPPPGPLATYGAGPVADRGRRGSARGRRGLRTWPRRQSQPHRRRCRAGTPPSPRPAPSGSCAGCRSARRARSTRNRAGTAGSRPGLRWVRAPSDCPKRYEELGNNDLDAV